MNKQPCLLARTIAVLCTTFATVVPSLPASFKLAFMAFKFQQDMMTHFHQDGICVIAFFIHQMFNDSTNALMACIPQFPPGRQRIWVNHSGPAGNFNVRSVHIPPTKSFGVFGGTSRRELWDTCHKGIGAVIEHLMYKKGNDTNPILMEMSHHILLNLNAIKANLKDAGREGATVEKAGSKETANPSTKRLAIALFFRVSRSEKEFLNLNVLRWSGVEWQVMMNSMEILREQILLGNISNPYGKGFYALTTCAVRKSFVTLSQRVPGLKKRLAWAMSNSNKRWGIEDDDENNQAPALTLKSSCDVRKHGVSIKTGKVYMLIGCSIEGY
ncbi:unnamed protein product [Lepeophtheirus salmonis]|uniref:(salmon louse) hypothetical protein n=1 Tax=Lepeophtheirus salmonis TaxID=72036 RepID=A0A817FAD3_LEPSM|nr:unnamed protein product [Lepeophtheirus salmonis]CAG9476445.1 unnamed protein product [Lepeophtheirus salmonis]